MSAPDHRTYEQRILATLEDIRDSQRELVELMKLRAEKVVLETVGPKPVASKRK